jgi:hypothetical protein
MGPRGAAGLRWRGAPDEGEEPILVIYVCEWDMEGVVCVVGREGLAYAGTGGAGQNPEHAGQIHQERIIGNMHGIRERLEYGGGGGVFLSAEFIAEILQRRQDLGHGWPVLDVGGGARQDELLERQGAARVERKPSPIADVVDDLGRGQVAVRSLPIVHLPEQGPKGIDLEGRQTCSQCMHEREGEARH